MAKVADTHGRRKNPAEQRVIPIAQANEELREVHRKIMQAYEVIGMSELDKSVLLERLFSQKRELLAIIRENESQ